MNFMGFMAVCGSIFFGFVAYDQDKPIGSLGGAVGSVAFFLIAILIFQGFDFTKLVS